MPQGWEALEPLKANDRAQTPYIRDAKNKLISTDWDTALRDFCKNFKNIQLKHGKESVAFLSTGQIPIEEMALLGSVAKFGMGIVHGDGNTRQCMASAATAYKQSFGFDAPPFTYQDYEESDTLIFIGANPCIAHPIMWERVVRNKHKAKIIVIDPRKTETASAATHHYPIQPKSDLYLLYTIAKILIRNDQIDHKYIKKNTNGFNQFKDFVSDFSLTEAAKRTEIDKDDILELCNHISTGKRVSFWWTMGVNQSHQGTKTAQAIINLALMTGNIGRPGTGANSITGQTNAMGSRLFSNTTGLLGGRDFLNPDHRKEVAEILDIDQDLIPDQNSLPYHKIIEGIKNGSIKGLWVIATNPGHSWIERNEFKEVIKNLDYLVVQDLYHTTDTAQLADLVLPAAGWSEKEGVVINSERRLGLYKKTNKAPNIALSDFFIFKLIAEYWGCGDLFKAWTSPSSTFQLLKKLSKGRPCDFSGIKDYKMINEVEGIQWPFTENDSIETSNQRRLFENGEFYHPDKKALFLFTEVTEPASKTNAEHPLILMSGRGSSSQWHTGTRTSKSSILKKLYPAKIYVEINPDDAVQFGITDGETVNILNKKATIEAHANITPTLQRGHLFIPMHYKDTNLLTHASFCTDSHQPSYKYAAVGITKQSH